MKSILIAISAPDVRRRFSEILSQAGYHVITAESGESAIDIAAAVQLDLVLMAIVLSNLDGLQTASRLRAISSPKSVPIILLGTVPPLGIDENPLASLVDDYLNLDVDADELLSCVTKHARS
ncbi:MAG TPA: response regulator [Pyrinomonadaceae bacterium]|nr:response regulator [Pyrinomonadaceae bacterium]